MYTDLKEQAWRANMEIPARNLAIYTWGNVSALDPDKAVFAIKPSGVPYDRLKAEDIVVVDLDGKVADGKLNPSSDTPTHAQLYRYFLQTHSAIRGITHTHSPYATSWAQACRSIPLLGTTHADHGFRPVPCTPYLSEKAVQTAYEKETGLLIIETLKNPSIACPVALPHKLHGCTGKGACFDEALNPAECQMVLVGGHGPFTWGTDAEKSVYNAAVLEEIAKMAWICMTVNPGFAPLPDYVIQKHYDRKHGKNAYYGQASKNR